MCEARCLVGGSAELEVAKTAASAFQQQHFLPVVGHVAYVFARFGVIYYGSARHVNVDVLSVGAVAFGLSAVAPVLGVYVALVFKVKQSPIVVVAAQVNAAAFAAVTAVGTSVGLVFGVS